MSKSLASTFMLAAPFPCRDSPRRVALGVERRRRGGQPRAQRAAAGIAALQLAERLGGGVRPAGLRVLFLPERDELVEPVRVERAHLEVHRRVVDAAQLGAAADERALP